MAHLFSRFSFIGSQSLTFPIRQSEIIAVALFCFSISLGIASACEIVSAFITNFPMLPNGKTLHRYEIKNVSLGKHNANVR